MYVGKGDYILFKKKGKKEIEDYLSSIGDILLSLKTNFVSFFKK